MGFTHGGIFFPPYCCCSNKCVALHYVLCIGKGSALQQGLYREGKGHKSWDQKRWLTALRNISVVKKVCVPIVCSY